MIRLGVIGHPSVLLSNGQTVPLKKDKAAFASSNSHNEALCKVGA